MPVAMGDLIFVPIRESTQAAPPRVGRASRQSGEEYERSIKPVVRNSAECATQKI